MTFWLAGIGAQLADDLTDETQRPVFDHHRRRIAALLATQPGLSPAPHVMGGFAVGYQLVRKNFVPAGTIERTAMLPTLGGIYLLGYEHHDAAVVDWADARRFFDRLAASLAAESPNRVDTDSDRGIAVEMICQALRFARVPLNHTSLAGVVLGVIYTLPYLASTPGGAGPVSLLAAASHLADQRPLKGADAVKRCTGGPSRGLKIRAVMITGARRVTAAAACRSLTR